MTLNFDQTYSLNGIAIDDPHDYNLPEPPSGSMLLLGGALIAAQRIFVAFRARYPGPNSQ